MSIVALTHGYPPFWNMGGEVSLHRTLLALDSDDEPVIVLTATPKPYVIDGIQVIPIDTPDPLDVDANPAPIAEQLRALNARVVIAQNELSLPGVKAARLAGAVSVVNVHTPPRYGGGVRPAIPLADYAVYNTRTSAREWGEPGALVIHPPIGPLPEARGLPTGDAYTLLSNLMNKGVSVVLDLARLYPQRRFIIVRSPASVTHGYPGFERLAARLPNVEVHDRVEPEAVAKSFLSQTRVLLVPSRFETYGMSAIEAAGYGIPSVHVDTPHVREGIGDAAELVRPLDITGTARALERIEGSYLNYSARTRKRAEEIAQRQTFELAKWIEFVAAVQPRSESSRETRLRRLRQTATGGHAYSPAEKAAIASHTRPSPYTRPHGHPRA